MPRTKEYHQQRIAASYKSWPELKRTEVRGVTKTDCLNWAARFGKPSRRTCSARLISLRSKVLKNRAGESWCQNHLADQQAYQLLEKVDGDLTGEARRQGCLLCGGKLHRHLIENQNVRRPEKVPKG